MSTYINTYITYIHTQYIHNTYIHTFWPMEDIMQVLYFHKKGHIFQQHRKILCTQGRIIGQPIKRETYHFSQYNFRHYA